MRKPKPTSLWSSLKADAARFRVEEPGVRGTIRGLLSQGFQALLVYRIFHWFHERGIPTQPVRFVVERFIEITTGISIPAEAEIGSGLRIHHFGGIIIHPHAVIGECCTIYQGVTVGDAGLRKGAPCIGDRVVIGAGAKVIGAIQVGDDTRIGANAVVTRSIPPRHIAVGVPAVARPLESRSGELPHRPYSQSSLG